MLNLQLLELGRRVLLHRFVLLCDRTLQSIFFTLVRLLLAVQLQIFLLREMQMLQELSPFAFGGSCSL